MKKLKYLLMVLLLSCAFVLSGCGDGQLGVSAEADIGNTNNYTVASDEDKQSLNTTVNDETATDVIAYRMTMDMTLGFGSEAITMKFNCIVSLAQNDYQMAVMMTTKVMGQSIKIKMYINDGWAYMEVPSELSQQYGGTKIKAQLPEGSEMTDMSMLEDLASLDLSNILALVKDMDLSDANVTVKVNTEGTTKRFEITQFDSNGFEQTSKMYLIFKDNVLSSCQMETTMDGCTAKVVIQEFDGEIEFPNPDGFTQVSEDMFLY